MNSLVLGVTLVFLFLFCKLNAQETELEIQERLVSYNRCRLDSDCNENSFCYGNDNNRIGLCKCQAGYELLFRNRTFYLCLQLATWGEPCQIDSQCVDTLGSLARCNGVCGCAENTYRYPWDGRCHKSTLLEDFCRTDANCMLEDGSYAYCTDGQCECNIGLRPSADKKRCIESKTLGQNCTDNYQCSFIENSVCREVCRCGVGYVVSRNISACLKAATYFFDPCEEGYQCSEFLRNSICNRGNCTCEDGFHGYETRCVRSADIGQACRATEECIPSPQFQNIADCIEGVCQCQPGVTDERMKCGNSSFKFSIDTFLVGLCMMTFYLFL